MCTFAALAACFSLSGVYVDAGLSHASVGEVRWERAEYRQKNHTTVIYHAFDSPQNPYGRIGLGYSLDFGKWSSRVEYSHESSLATNKDRGVERLTVSVTWRPFK